MHTYMHAHTCDGDGDGDDDADADGDDGDDGNDDDASVYTLVSRYHLFFDSLFSHWGWTLTHWVPTLFLFLFSLFAECWRAQNVALTWKRVGKWPRGTADDIVALPICHYGPAPLWPNPIMAQPMAVRSLKTRRKQKRSGGDWMGPTKSRQNQSGAKTAW